MISPPLEEIKKGVLTFAKKREKKEGGFSATPFLPPTVEDTYFGCGIFALCQSIDQNFRTKHLNYLASILWNELPPETLLYYLKTSLILNGALPNQKDLKKYLEKFFTKTSSLKRLAILFILAQLLDSQEGDVGLSRFKERVKDEILKNQAKEGRLTLELFYYLLPITSRFVEKHLDFVFASQNPDGGFGFMPKTTSFIENTYFAVKILSFFDRLDKEILRKVQGFVISCLNADFGFGRNSQGISFLNTTYYGLAILTDLLKG